MSTAVQTETRAEAANLEHDQYDLWDWDDLQKLDRANLPLAQFKKLRPLSQFVALTQSFAFLCESVAFRRIAPGAPELLELLGRLDKKSTTFMNGAVRQLTDYEFKIGNNIDTAAARGYTALDGGAAAPTAEEFLCLLLATVHGQYGNAMHNMRIAAEATQNFTEFDVHGPISPSWEEEDAEDKAAPIAA